MELLSAEGIILELRQLQEADDIVTFLTAEHGQTRGVAKGARRKFSRLGGQLQLLAKVRISWRQKEGVELARVASVEIVRSAARLMEALDDILLATYLAEQAATFSQENEESARLYRLLDSCIEALLAGRDRQTVARYFETWILRLNGIFPSSRQCPLCGGPYRGGATLVAADEALLCNGCATSAGGGGLRLSNRALAFLDATTRRAPGEVEAERPDRGALAEVESLCSRLRREFLQYELRSYRVMKETLASVPREENETG